jgi:cytochrome c biogenesis protein CcdA
MKQLLEWSGMGMVVVGIVTALVGLVVLLVTQSSWITYAIGYAVGLLGLAILFWAALRDRLRARKTDDLDDVGFH